MDLRNTAEIEHFLGNHNVWTPSDFIYSDGPL